MLKLRKMDRSVPRYLLNLRRDASLGMKMFPLLYQDLDKNLKSLLQNVSV